MRFSKGDRVRIRKDRADEFIEPWRSRFKKGRAGTVIYLLERGVGVQWDCVRTKYPHEWRMIMQPQDLVMDRDKDG